MPVMAETPATPAFNLNDALHKNGPSDIAAIRREFARLSDALAAETAKVDLLVETFSRWSLRGKTDDGETPIDDYGKRVLSMAIRELPSRAARSEAPHE